MAPLAPAGAEAGVVVKADPKFKYKVNGVNLREPGIEQENTR